MQTPHQRERIKTRLQYKSSFKSCFIEKIKAQFMGFFFKEIRNFYKFTQALIGHHLW
jgi:hypothetical protein